VGERTEAPEVEGGVWEVRLDDGTRLIVDLDRERWVHLPKGRGIWTQLWDMCILDPSVKSPVQIWTSEGGEPYEPGLVIACRQIA